MSPAIMKMEPKTEESKSQENFINTKNKKTLEKNERKGKKSLELRPHLEQQLRIAQLIDNNNKEDPKLKETLKKIVEATQKSYDEAYTALHDCDYDINRAVNKLLEDDNSEWSTLSKKKKSKEMKEEPEKEIVKESTAVMDSHTTAKTRGFQRDGYKRGRGRGGRRIEVRESQGSPGRRVFINSALEARTMEMLEATRARPPPIRPVDHWDPSRPISDLLTRGARNDFEDEEYSGPLHRGLVFTSSNFGRHQLPEKKESKKLSRSHSRSESPAIGKSSIPMRSDKLVPENDKASLIDKKIVDTGLSLSSKDEPDVSTSQSNDVPPPKATLVMRAPPMTASVVKAPPRSDKPPSITMRRRSSSIPACSKPSTGVVKKPITPVEMPPDSDSNVELLDITFGAVDLDENTYEVITRSDSSSELFFGNKPPEDMKSSYGNVKERSSVENLRIVKDLKLDNSFYESPVRNAYHKSTQKSKSSNTFSNTTLPTEPSPSYCMTPPPISMSHPTSTGLQSASLTQIPYFNSHSNPPLSYYQNVISAPTYTTNSQYASSALSSPSYSVPYQSYSSMVQGHKPLPPSSLGDLENMANHSVSSMNFTSPNFSIPLANVDAAGKGVPQGTKNLPALVGHHQVMLGQTGVTYFQPPLYFQDVQMVQQGRGGFYEYAAGSPPRTDYTVPPPDPAVVYPDPAAAHYPPPVCLPPTDTSRKPPPFQLPQNQLVYRGGKRVSSPSQVRSYN